MPRSQFSSQPRPPLFLNRHEQLKLIGEHVALHQRDSRHLMVFEVLGLGGAGKTQILKEMQRRAGEGTRVRHVIWVSLDDEASGAVWPLCRIRNGTPFECHLFDTALLTYLAITGQPPPSEADSVTGSLAFEMAEAGAAIAQVNVPAKFAVRVARTARRRLARKWNYDDKDFAEIDAFRDDQTALRERLPHWLGVDILRRIETTGDTLAVFYDGYENQSALTLADRAPWLRELIGTLNRGVHVIATRERLCWEKRDPMWEGFVQTVRVDELPDDEARELVRAGVGDVPRDIEDRLLRASRRVPFYLEAGISNYLDMAAKGAVDVNRLPATQEAILKRLIGHLARDERSLAIALAAFQFFDQELFLFLVRQLHVPVNGLEFSSYVHGWFFFDELGGGLYKTHDLLTDFVRVAEGQADLRQMALTTASEALRLRCIDDCSARSVLPIFAGIMAGWQSIGDVPTTATEALVDVAYHLHDAGYWHELSTLAVDSAPDAEHPIGAIADLFIAIGARRSAGVDRAIELMARMEPRAAMLGKHQRSVEIEAAYLSELAGNYAKARAEFRKLDEQASPFDPTDRTHLRARLYRADMMINDGELLEASRLLLDASSQLDRHASLTYAELVRHRAHAFRFSFLMEAAERQYREALQNCDEERAPGLEGKLRTNLAEAMCWHAPDAALEEARVSHDLNSRRSNRIELSKCDAARAIALARLGEINAARDAATRSAILARDVGYPAGVAFAIQARAVVEHLDGRPDQVAAACAELGATVDNLGTYGHLRVIPALLTGDTAAFERIAAPYDWIAGDEVSARLERLLGPASVS